MAIFKPHGQLCMSVGLITVEQIGMSLDRYFKKQTDQPGSSG